MVTVPAPRDLTARQVFERFLKVPARGTRALVPVVIHPALDELLTAYDTRDPVTNLPTWPQILDYLPKKWGKSTGGGGLGLADLVANSGESDREVLVVASDLAQSRDVIFASAVRFVQRDGWLQKHVRILRSELVYRESVTDASTGGRHTQEHVLRALPARDARSLHGANASLTLIDELWTQEGYDLLEALALSATRKAPRVVFFTYAGLRHQAHEGFPLWDLLERHKRGDPGLYVVQRSGDTALQSHPFASPQFIEQQRRAFAAVPSKFKRLWENVWTAGDEGSFLSAEEIRAAVDPSLHEPDRPEPGIKYSLGVDLGISHDWSAAVVSHVAANMLVIDAVRFWRGTRTRPVSLIDVEQELVTLARTFPLTRITFDQWQGAHMAERLRAFLKCSVSTVVCDPVRLDKHAAMLKGAFSGRHIRIPNHPELVEQLETIIGTETRRRDKVRFTSGGGIGAGAHDDLIVALCLSAEADASAIGARRLPPMEACPLEVYRGRAGVNCFLWDPDAGVISPDDGVCGDCIGLRAVRDALAAHVARGGQDTGLRNFYRSHFSPNALVQRKKAVPGFDYWLTSNAL